MRRKSLRLAGVARPLMVLSIAAGVGAVHAQDSGGSAPASSSGTSSSTSAATVQDEKAPWYLGLRQGFAWNDNLYKQPQGQEQSDAYSSTVLLAGINKPFGRQRFFLDGSYNFDRYQDYKNLDNDGYNLSTGIDFQTLGDVSGTLRYSAQRSLADYGGADSQPLNAKNIQQTQVFAANGRVGLTRRLSLTALGEHRSLDYSAPEYAINEYTQNVYGGGFTYGLPDLLLFGVTYRVTNSDRPTAQLTSAPGALPRTYAPDESDRRDIDFTVSWQPSALSTFTGRISKSDEEHTNPTFADFDGWTGALGWQYRPTAKLNFGLGLTRDTGSEILASTVSSSNGQPSTPQSYDTARITNAAYLNVGYEVTAKVRSNFGFNVSRTTSDGGNGAAGDNTRTNHYKLGLDYAATQALSFGCAYDYERQSGDGPNSVYKSQLVSCFGQYTLR
jgi:hypothetical protein